MTTFATAVKDFWINNAYVRHGLLPDEFPKLSDAVNVAKSGLWPMVAALGLGLGGGVLATWLASGPGATPPPGQLQSTAVNEGSLYQFLEDQNLHLPLGGGP